MKRNITIITFSITDPDDNEKTLLLRVESHMISLQYSKYLMLEKKHLQRIGIELYHKLEQKYTHISDYSKSFPLCVNTKTNNLTELLIEEGKEKRLFLELELLQELMLEVVKHYDWDKVPFEEAYQQTKEHLEKGKELQSFEDFMIKNY